MVQNLFQNQPNEYTDDFNNMVIKTNYKMVHYVLIVLLPISLFMLLMSIIIKDNISIIIANVILAVFTVVLLIADQIIIRIKLTFNHIASSWVVYLTYAVILFWGMHMMGYNQEKVIFMMDMVIAIFILAFLFMTKYQVLASYYVLSLLYLFLFTPYSIGIFDYFPKLMTPILLVVSAFFFSRMLFSQFMERFIMSEKLKKSNDGLTSELYSTLEKLRITERSISNDIIRTLVKVLEYHDFYTRGHSENVAEYAGKIATEMELSQERVDEILICGLLHDIGKILIPVHLLNKSSLLSQEEYTVIKKHSEYGYEMLMEAKHLKQIARIILHHHERWDGTGYPLGLKGNDIPLESQILMVADAWDAMTSERIYKEAKSIDEAKQEMIDLKGKQFAPNVVDLLLRIVIINKSDL